MSRRQTTLRPSQGGRFAGPVGSPVPAAASDIFADLAALERAAGPTPDQVPAEIRSVRQRIEPTREPLTGTSFSGMPRHEPSTGAIPPPYAGDTDDVPSAATAAVNDALDRARRRHPELAFGVQLRKDDRPFHARAWRIFAADVDETRSIDVTVLDVLATRGENLDTELDRLAGMFPSPAADVWGQE